MFHNIIEAVVIKSIIIYNVFLSSKSEILAKQTKKQGKHMKYKESTLFKKKQNKQNKKPTTAATISHDWLIKILSNQIRLKYSLLSPFVVVVEINLILV